MRHWSGMLIQSGGSKPFVASLMQILADEFPFIIFKMGGFVDRDIRGRPGVKSMHASGRAIDIYLDVKYRQERALGKLLYAMFKDNAISPNTGHVIYDGLVWSAGSKADRSTRDAGVRDLHNDHVHVDFTTTGIEGNASALKFGIKFVRRRLSMEGYKDWVDGYYGPAFNPTSNNTRLTVIEREAIYYMNKGQTSMSLAPAYLHAVERVAKWRSAGKLPEPVGNDQT
jgi:hypothetical protein